MINFIQRIGVKCLTAQVLLKLNSLFDLFSSIFIYYQETFQASELARESALLYNYFKAKTKHMLVVPGEKVDRNYFSVF